MLSRVADHLYWLGRYAERAEHTARVINVQIHLDLEESEEMRQRKLTDMLISLRQPHLPVADFDDAAWKLSLDPQNQASVCSCVRFARENARQIRERISSEMWEQVNRVHLYTSEEAKGTLFERQPQQFFREVLTGIHLFNGLTDSTMSRDQAWLFIQTGRWLERAGLLVTLFETYLKDAHSKTYLDWLGLLKCCTAFEAFRKKRGVNLGPVKIVEFLILNERFPHSLLFSIAKLRAALLELADETENRKTRDLDRTLGKMHHDLEYARAEEVMGGNLSVFFDRFRSDLRSVHAMLYNLYISWEVEL